MIQDNALVCINTSKEESSVIAEIKDPVEIYWGASFGGEDSIYVLTGNKELYSLSFLYRDHSISAEAGKILDDVLYVDVKETTVIIETAQGNYEVAGYEFYAMKVNSEYIPLSDS